MINKDIDLEYTKYYKGKKLSKLYPTEFVVRSFLGTYPNLKPNSKSFYKGKKVLDLGCGDGRNIPFLSDLGYRVYGLEINKEIVDYCSKNLEFNNYEASLQVGNNSNSNFQKEFFDCIVACHSFYYLNNNDCFNSNLNEISRILKKGGRFIFSIPNHKSYLLRNAEILEDNYAIIKNDPLGIRNGLKIKFFETDFQIINFLTNRFEEFKIGICENNWWGLEEFYWTVSCTSK